MKLLIGQIVPVLGRGVGVVTARICVGGVYEYRFKELDHD